MNFGKNRDSLLKLIDEIVGRNFISSNFPSSVCLSWCRPTKYGVVDVEVDKCIEYVFVYHVMYLSYHCFC